MKPKWSRPVVVSKAGTLRPGANCSRPLILAGLLGGVAAGEAQQPVL